MKSIFIILLTLLLMYSYSYANYNTWITIKKDNSATYYIDTKSIVKNKTGIVNFWVKITREDNFFYNNSKVNYNFDNYEINCNTYKYKELDKLIIDDDNDVINRSPPSMIIEYKIIPKSMIDVYYNYICKVK